MREVGSLLTTAIVLVLVAFAPRVSAAQGGVTGRWQAESTPPGTTWTAVLRADGPRVVGAISSCGLEISEGSFVGSAVTFKCSIGERTTVFRGVLRDDEIVFSWELQQPADYFPIPASDRFFGPSAPREFIAKRVPDVADSLTATADAARKAPAVTSDRILRADQEPHHWLTFSGTYQSHRHSTLTQITPANVKGLELSWLWQSDSYPGGFQATPLVVDEVLYTVEAPNNVVALDAATGRELWKLAYASLSTSRVAGHVSNRGLGILGGTLFVGTIDAHLLAIDAYSGKLIWDVRVADPRDAACTLGRCYGITHAPLVVKDKVIVGVAGGDDTTPGKGIRAFIAAFDPRTGREIWRFHTIPAAGEPGNETWSGDSWKTGGAGVWVTGSYDAEFNLTYWGTGNPAPTGSHTTRIGDNLFSASVVALDADTGKLRWHYQFTPHDDFDWDSAQVPVLVDITKDGRPRKAMLWANRNGLYYLLDRATGEFIMGKPFAEVNWMSGFDTKGRPIPVPEKVRGAKTLILPGDATNWFPPSYSPRTGLFYVSVWERGTQGGARLRGTPGYGAVRALDPLNGERKWEFRRDDAIFSAGVMTTASGLLFTGVQGDPNSDPAAARRADRYFYALNASTGELLWQLRLTDPVLGSPISYAVADKQFVAVNAGRTLFVFALRE
jgi:alcohol dehydrogenase (cytochrome c)